MSIDQQYYWMAIILIASFLLYRHLVPASQPMNQPEEGWQSNATLRSLSHWRSLVSPIDQSIQENKILRKNLTQLLLSLYAVRQHTSADFRLYEALQQRQLPLPEQIHDFLFLAELQPARPPLQKLAYSLANAPRKWIRRWTGQETAEHYRLIDETLCFLETSLEIKNGDRKFNPPQH